MVDVAISHLENKQSTPSEPNTEAFMHRYFRPFDIDRTCPKGRRSWLEYSVLS